MDSSDGASRIQSGTGGVQQHLGITSALTQALFPPTDSQAFQAVKGVRDALDEVKEQVKRDFLHRQASRPGFENLTRSYSNGNIATSPRSRPLSPSPVVMDVHAKPTVNPVLESNFLDFYQSRRASNHLPARIPKDGALVATALGFPQPNRSAVAATGLAMQERPASPSGLKQVLSQLHPVRSPVVALHNHSGSSEAISAFRSPAAGPRGYNSIRTGRDLTSWSTWASSSTVPRGGNIYDRDNIRIQGRPSLQESLGRQRSPDLITPAAAQLRPWDGSHSPVRPGSPQNQLVLRTLALHTPHNIVAPGCLDAAPENVGGATSSSPERRGSPYVSSMAAGQLIPAGASPARLGSPSLGTLMYCSGCNQQHTLQQHHSCCHQCRRCCHCHSCNEQHAAPAAEASSASSEACPCVKAYKKGHRDAQQASAARNSLAAADRSPTAGRSGTSSASAAAAEAAAAAAQARAVAAEQEQQRALAAAQAAAIEAQAALATAAEAYTPAEHMAEAADAADVAGESSQDDHLMGLLLQTIEMQHQLLQENPPYEAQTLEELSDHLAQMVALSEPQHEELLRQALALQQELLALQQRALLASTSGAGAQPPALQMPHQLQQQQQAWDSQEAAAGDDRLSLQVWAPGDRTGSWVAQHQQHTQQPWDGGQRGGNGQVSELMLGPRPEAQSFNRPTAASTAAGVGRPLGDMTAAEYSSMSQPDRLAAGATGNSYNNRGSLSMGNRRSGKVSWVDNPIAQQEHEQLLGLLSLQDDEGDELVASTQYPVGSAGVGFEQYQQRPAFTQQQSGRSISRSFREQQATPSQVAPEDSEGILAAVQAAYDDAFAAAGSAKPVMHFMIAPDHNTQTVLHQGRPQVTAVAQFIDFPAGQVPGGAAVVSGLHQQDISNVASPGGRSVADSAQSMLASGLRNVGQRVSMPANIGVQQQQDFGSPAAAAADVAGPAMLEQQGREVAMMNLSTASSQHTGVWPRAKAASAREYLEQQLSRLGSVRGSQSPRSSAAGSAVSTPHGKRSAQSAAGGAVGSGAMGYVPAAAPLAGVSDPGSLSSSSVHSSMAGATTSGVKVQGPRGSNMVFSQQQVVDAIRDGGNTQSPRGSVRFLEASQTTMDELPPQGTASRVSATQNPASNRSSFNARQSLSPQMSQRQSVQAIGQRLESMRARISSVAASRQQQQQQHSLHQSGHSDGSRMSVARAGSFEAPDSTASSAVPSAQPSAAQMPVAMSGAFGQIVATAPVQPQTAAAAAALARAAASRSASIASVQRATGTPIQASQDAVPQAVTAGMPQNAAAVAARRSAAASMIGSENSRQQKVELDGMASPVASAPASNRTSLSQLEINLGLAQVAGLPQQQMETHAQQQRHTSPPQQLQTQVRELSSRMSSRKSLAAVASGAATPGSNSDWKQQMQQQLLSQQQQLRQIQSLSNSVASTPRTSAVSSPPLVRGSMLATSPRASSAVSAARPAAADDAHSSLQQLAAELNPQQQHTQESPSRAGTVTSPVRASLAPSVAAEEEQQQMSLAAFRESQWQIAANPGHQQLAVEPRQQQFSVATPIAAEPLAALAALPAAVEVADISSDQQDGSDPDTASEDLAGNADAVLQNALLQRLLRRRQGRMMQKALNCWWRYAVARKALAAWSAKQSDRVSDMHSVSSGVAVTPSLDQQQHQTQSIKLALKDLEEGLQQYLTGALADDEAEFVISGEVRVQRSPVKQRPGSAEAVKSSNKANNQRVAGLPDGKSPVKSNAQAPLAVEATAAALAAYAKPLQDALLEVRSMVEAMEGMCIDGGNSNGRRRLQQKGATGLSAAARAVAASKVAFISPGQLQRLSAGSAVAANGQQYVTPKQQAISANRLRSCQQGRLQPAGVLACMRSPDKHKLRGQLKHVQDRLVKLEVKMCQAQAMTDDSACSAAPHRNAPPHRQHISAAGAESFDRNQGLVSGCGVMCKGGCVHRAGARRRVLVGRMQDEIGQLQRELAELRDLLPGAYV